MKREYVAPTLFTLYVIYTYLVDRLFEIYDKLPMLGDIMNTCIVSPLWEEAVYRYAPIEICKILNEKLIVPVVIYVSFLFGFGHDGTIENIYYQGVFGLMLSAVYLRVKHPYLTVFFLHFLWNFLVTILKY